MLRFYIRQFTWRTNQLYSVRASRNQFCSTINEGDNSKQSGEVVETESIRDVLNKTVEEKSTENILDSKRNWRATKACDAIIAIGDLKREAKIAQSELQTDERFKSLLKTLESEHIRKVEPLKLISSLKALNELGLPDDSFVVKNLENSLIWECRSCAIKDLVMMLSFTITRNRTDSQKKLFSEVTSSLERRWVEIRGSSPLIVQAATDNFWILMNKNHFNTLVESGKNMSKPVLLKDIADGKVFASLIYYQDQFSGQFMAKLEDRISEVMEDLAPGDMVIILGQLARRRRRTVPLLKSLSFYIWKHKSSLDVKQISDCLFAFTQLSYKDKDTAEKLCNEMVGKVAEVEATPVLRSVLRSLGQMKYLHTPLLEAIMTWYTRDLESEARRMEVKDMTTLLLTLATLDHVPLEHSRLLDLIVKELGDASSSLPENVWLDTVWSLTVLGKVTHNQLQSVLNSNFYNVILYQSSSKQIGNTMKVLNINAAAKLLIQDYTGSTLSVEDDALMKNIKVYPGVAKVQYNKSVLEAFSTLFPPPRLSSLEVNTLMGFVAEAEAVLDADGRPLAVQEFSDGYGAKAPSKPLPEGGRRLTLVTASFQDCLLGGQMSGVTSLNVRLLEAMGHKVLVVNYTQWPVRDTLVSR